MGFTTCSACAAARMTSPGHVLLLVLWLIYIYIYIYIYVYIYIYIYCISLSLYIYIYTCIYIYIYILYVNRERDVYMYIYTHTCILYYVFIDWLKLIRSREGGPTSIAEICGDDKFAQKLCRKSKSWLVKFPSSNAIKSLSPLARRRPKLEGSEILHGTSRLRPLQLQPQIAPKPVL